MFESCRRIEALQPAYCIISDDLLDRTQLPLSLRVRIGTHSKDLLGRENALRLPGSAVQNIVGWHPADSFVSGSKYYSILAATLICQYVVLR
jgi:hypothetical protein